MLGHGQLYTKKVQIDIKIGCKGICLQPNACSKMCTVKTQIVRMFFFAWPQFPPAEMRVFSSAITVCSNNTVSHGSDTAVVYLRRKKLWECLFKNFNTNSLGRCCGTPSSCSLFFINNGSMDLISWRATHPAIHPILQTAEHYLDSGVGEWVCLWWVRDSSKSFQVQWDGHASVTLNNHK